MTTRLRLGGVGMCALLVPSLLLGAPKTDAEKPWTGTICVSGKHSPQELARMAEVTVVDAEKAALAAIEAKDSDKKVKARELEVEHGFLIYWFDVKVAGTKGIEEILVDAGDGSVLAREHE